MDRLPALIVVLALAGCEDKQAAAPSSRVNAAKVTAKKTDPAAFCDKLLDGASAPAFVAPALAGGELRASTKWRWINVWATWCKPCVEEMPRLLRWQAQLASFELQFVSVDESDEVIADYRKQHPSTPPSVRLADPDAQGKWFAQLGLDAGAPIPVHVLVDPQGRVRCVRAGGVREQDLDAIQAVLAAK